MGEPRRKRVLSGMRPTGSLHLGHYHCVLKNWVRMQEEFDCLYFVADWHALTTSAQLGGKLSDYSRDMVVGWLAAGVDPDKSVIFVQSEIREHAELNLMLGMLCPLPWAERLPTFREIADKMRVEDVSIGFLNYPVLQAADIIVHDADLVPVGEDQLPHIEFAREIARRFNNYYGKAEGWQQKSGKAAACLENAQEFERNCECYRRDGDGAARAAATAMAEAVADRESRQFLLGRIDGGGRSILREPHELLENDVSKMTGLDGRKMSKSYGNAIGMLDERGTYERNVLRMATDPARVRRTDPGSPDKCPVWELHKLHTPPEQRKWVVEGCTSAGIGCRDCKGALVDNLEKLICPLRERAAPWLADPGAVDKLVARGNMRARESAARTMADVREAVGLPASPSARPA